MMIVCPRWTGGVRLAGQQHRVGGDADLHASARGRAEGVDAAERAERPIGKAGRHAVAVRLAGDEAVVAAADQAAMLALEAIAEGAGAAVGVAAGAVVDLAGGATEEAAAVEAHLAAGTRGAARAAGLGLTGSAGDRNAAPAGGPRPRATAAATLPATGAAAAPFAALAAAARPCAPRARRDRLARSVKESPDNSASQGAGEETERVPARRCTFAHVARQLIELYRFHARAPRLCSWRSRWSPR